MFCSLGGDTGWLVWNWTWRLRGFIDKLFGEPGLRRGRRHPYELLPGEAVDFWRVEEVVPNRRLRLRAEGSMCKSLRIVVACTHAAIGTALRAT